MRGREEAGGDRASGGAGPETEYGTVEGNHRSVRDKKDRHLAATGQSGGHESREHLTFRLLPGRNAWPKSGGMASAQRLTGTAGRWSATHPWTVVAAWLGCVVLVLLTGRLFGTHQLALLLVSFRSLVIPATAVVLNLLSVGAAYGVIVALFQWGWGQSLLGFRLRAAHRPPDAARGRPSRLKSME